MDLPVSKDENSAAKSAFLDGNPDHPSEREIDSGLGALVGLERLVVTLYIGAGIHVSEIAGMLGTPYPRIEGIMARGFRRLERILRRRAAERGARPSGGNPLPASGGGAPGAGEDLARPSLRRKFQEAHRYWGKARRLSWNR